MTRFLLAASSLVDQGRQASEALACVKAYRDVARFWKIKMSDEANVSISHGIKYLKYQNRIDVGPSESESYRIQRSVAIPSSDG